MFEPVGTNVWGLGPFCFGGGMAGLVKAEVLGKGKEDVLDGIGRSTQLPEDTWDYDKTKAKEPPYNLDSLALFLEINTWHLTCPKLLYQVES